MAGQLDRHWRDLPATSLLHEQGKHSRMSHQVPLS
jgi:hypothetical protein